MSEIFGKLKSIKGKEITVLLDDELSTYQIDKYSNNQSPTVEIILNIGFKTQTWDMLPDDYAMVMRCCKHRKCIICLNHADIDHTFGLVGIGRDRRTVDNSKSYFLPLCRKHHQERHNLGAKNFLNKYHIKPVKLNAQTRKELRIGK